jgi:hypothetical protein
VLTDGIVDGCALREHGSPDGEQRRHSVLAKYSSEVDNAVWRPGDEPQGDSHHCDLMSNSVSRKKLMPFKQSLQ